MKPFAHDILQRHKHVISRAVAGMEVRMRIGVRQSVGEFTEFILRLMPVEQMKATYDLVHGKRGGSKDVFQSTVSTASKQQAVGIEGQFMTEIVRDIRSFGILGKEVLIALRHRMHLWDAGNDIQVI